MAHEVFPVTIDGEEHDLTEDNHTVAMFRDDPEFDYLVIRPEDELTEEQRTILVFRQQWLCHWMGNLALNSDDQEVLDAANAEYGIFREMTGWNSKLLIEDRANDFEKEYFTQGLLTDLGDTMPEDWS